jgi:carbon storage regulator CsrA
MLVLSRKVDQEIVVGEHIRIRVLSVRGNRVRIGLEAPATTPIRRVELEPLDSPGEPAPLRELAVC